MELALPITVYWDLAPDKLLDDELLRLCDEILECRPLMLQLYDPSSVLSEGASAVLERFRETPVAVSFTAPYSNITSLDIASPAISGVSELLIACDDLETIRELPRLPEAGLSFNVNSDNWHELPGVVSYCREQGLLHLVLPMQRLYNGNEPFLLNRREQQMLECSLADIGGTGALRLTIHDPFLWRAFNPELPFPQGGCQAANTMIAISHDGVVCPCPTLPERLGVIGSISLKEIITSPAKKELRRRITDLPADCSGCPDTSVCRGGCRGRSYVMNGTFDDIDAACR